MIKTNISREVVGTCPGTCVFYIIVAWHVFGDNGYAILFIARQQEGGGQPGDSSSAEVRTWSLKAAARSLTLELRYSAEPCYLSWSEKNEIRWMNQVLDCQQPDDSIVQVTPPSGVRLPPD